MSNIKQLKVYADSIFDYLVENDLEYDIYDYDEFSSELDFAILNGDIVEMPELVKEDAFKLAVEMSQNADDYDESMDGDFDSSMKSAGTGTDEDYGFYGNEDDIYGESVIKEANEIMTMLKDSLASKKAKKLGLVHVGFGNYAEEPGSSAEYKTVDGKLRKIGGTPVRKQKQQIQQEPIKKKEEPKKDKPKPKSGITNIRRSSGQKATYEFEKDGKKYKFTLNKQEQKELKSEGSILSIIKNRLKKKAEREKIKQFKKGKHVPVSK